jgi:hypothetical protein
LPFALGWPRDDVACWLRAVPLDDAATELLRWIDRETLSHLMLQAGMHTYPPRLVVASREELVRLATAQLEDDHVDGRKVLDLTAAVLVVAAVALGASAASVARARELWPPMLEPRPRPPPPPFVASHAAADMDGDGDLDELPGNSGSPNRVLLNAGDGTFPTSIELPGGSARTNSIAAADVEDSDGDLDDDEDEVIAKARKRSAPELREERAVRRRYHPTKMDWQAETEGAQPSPSAVRLPPPHFSAHPDSASSGGRDEPLSVLYPLCDYVRIHFSPTGCTSRHTEGVAIEVLHHELAVWLGRTVHAGGANSEDARDVCLRMHGHVDSRAYTRHHGTTDLCPFADGSGSGFVASRSYTGRSDLLPSSLESAAEILFSSGVVILPDPGRLLSMEHERDIVAFSSVSNRPVAADSLVNGWRPIFNSSPSAVVENRQRQAWRDPAWAHEFEARVAATLRRARLLEHAYVGPHAGHEKSVCDSSALRSLPGCTQQPWHADYAREY